MNLRTKWWVTGALGAALFLTGESPDAPHAPTFVRSAHAIIGMPFTPLSYAGVARRTARRTVAFEGAAMTASAETAAAQQQAAAAQQQAAAAAAQQQAAAAQKQAAAAQQQATGAVPMGTVVTTLPAGCKAQAQGGVEYQVCGGVKYRAAFQGNNLVYVSQ
jgi:hypothetical protein